MNQRELKQVLAYDPSAGEFTWNERGVAEFNSARAAGAFNGRFAGKVAGTTQINGYISININRVRFYAHRLAFLYVYGAWPKGDTDHINGDRSDNRITNLRQCSRSENLQNMRRKDNNISGISGVYWSTQAGKWHARIGYQNNTVHLGYFSHIFDAAATRISAQNNLGFSPRHGR